MSTDNKIDEDGGWFVSDPSEPRPGHPRAGLRRFLVDPTAPDPIPIRRVEVTPARTVAVAPPEIVIADEAARRRYAAPLGPLRRHVPIQGWYSMRDAVVVFPSASVFVQGRLLRERADSRQARIRWRDMARAWLGAQETRDHAVLLRGPSLASPGMWLPDVAARLAIVDGDPRLAGHPIILPASMPARVRAILTLTRCADRLAYGETGVIGFKELFVAGPVDAPAGAIGAACDWLREAVPGADPSSAPRRLVLMPPVEAMTPMTRGLAAIALARGYAPLHQPGHDPMEEIGHLKAADAVILMPGAEAEMIAFCRPGTSVGEVHGADIPPAVLEWRRTLAAEAGLRYGCLLGTATGRGLTVDPAAFLRLLEWSEAAARVDGQG